MATIQEEISQHKTEIKRLEEVQRRSDLYTTEYHTKLLLEILERLNELTKRVVVVEGKVLAAEIQLPDEQ
jgi:hypothetical protein